MRTTIAPSAVPMMNSSVLCTFPKKIPRSHFNSAFFCLLPDFFLSDVLKLCLDKAVSPNGIICP